MLDRHGESYYCQEGMRRCQQCGARFKKYRYTVDENCDDCRAHWWQEVRRKATTAWSIVGPSHVAKLLACGAEVRLASIRDMRASPLDHDYRRGPEGRALCWWCRREVPKGRRSWCGDDCVGDYKLHHDWGVIRSFVYRRDRGVCCLCGVDTDQARQRWRHIYWAVGRRPTVEVLRLLRWPADISRDWWEADHIRARSEGGSDHPDNLRTLCVPCHKDRTRIQVGEWARRRREQNDETAPALFRKPVLVVQLPERLRNKEKTSA